jgi:stage V sporulation protein D (sporulation-specific penicillin-binding protein)
MARVFSDIFGIDYDSTLEKCKSNKSVETIVKKVDKEKVNQLKQWMSENKVSTGINFDEDIKRYYPNGSLASNLIGFCTDDNVGLTGLELKWDDTLTGVSGKIVTARSLKGDAISEENEQYIAAENGSNIYLTIDTKIQSIAEKYLKQAVSVNYADGGNVIIMNPTTGDILAMVTEPDYNLNDPRNYANLKLNEAQWNALQPEEKSEKLNTLWKNKIVEVLPDIEFFMLTIFSYNLGSTISLFSHKRIKISPNHH